MKKTAIVCLIVLLPLAASATGEAGVSIRLGTLGLGIEAATSVLPKLNIRGGIQGFSGDLEEVDADDIEYNFSLDFLTLGVLADWHAFDGGFRLSGGLMINNNEMVGIAAPQNVEYEIGDQTYRPDDVGTLKGTLGFSSLSPYLGVGWGNMVGDGKKWGLMADIGLLFQGSPEVDFSASGLIAEDPEFVANLEREERRAEEDLEEFDAWPVISIGVSYRFF